MICHLDTLKVKRQMLSKCQIFCAKEAHVRASTLKMPRSSRQSQVSKDQKRSQRRKQSQYQTLARPKHFILPSMARVVRISVVMDKNCLLERL